MEHIDRIAHAVLALSRALQDAGLHAPEAIVLVPGDTVRLVNMAAPMLSVRDKAHTGDPLLIAGVAMRDDA